MNARGMEIMREFDTLQDRAGGGTVGQGASFLLGVRGKDAQELLQMVMVQTITAFDLDYLDLDSEVKGALLFAVRSGVALGVASKLTDAEDDEAA